jgi:hypothetical protein
MVIYQRITIKTIPTPAGYPDHAVYSKGGILFEINANKEGSDMNFSGTFIAQLKQPITGASRKSIHLTVQHACARSDD